MALMRGKGSRGAVHRAGARARAPLGTLAFDYFVANYYEQIQALVDLLKYRTGDIVSKR